MRLPHLRLYRVLALSLLAVALASHGQTLAHPGWRGNGVTVATWYSHTTVVAFPDGTTFQQASASLDSLTAVGADSLILPGTTPFANAAHPFADAAGTEDDLDTLLRETAARHMHVLLQEPLSRLAANAGEVRYWMSHGIAGFDLGPVTADSIPSLTSLRSLLDTFVGERILLAQPQTALPLARRSAMPLAFPIIDGTNTSAAGNTPQFVKTAGLPAGKADNNALLRGFLPLLLTAGQPILDSRLIATEAGRSAMGQMLAIRNSRPALHAGRAIQLQSGNLRAWLFKAAATGQRSLVILENPDAVPLTLHLQQPLHAAAARGTFLRAILRTDGGMGALDLESSVLPPGSFVIAELQ